MSEPELVRVRDVMKVDFDVVDGLATVADALRDMKHIDTKALMVRKRNDDDEYGIVELEDIATEVLARNRAPERVNIYEIMEKPIDRGRPGHGHPLLRAAVRTSPLEPSGGGRASRGDRYRQLHRYRHQGHEEAAGTDEEPES